MLDAQHVPRVKVCGLARQEDVSCALKAGADALGFVLHAPSPRSVTARQARELTLEVPASVPTVAVVVNANPTSARELLVCSGLQAIQLCGDQLASDWCDFPHPILRRLAVTEEAHQELQAWKSTAAAFVLDHPSSAGGSGRTVDFALAAALCNQANCLLAGGLSADNVAEAIRQVSPLGVDASSRLEQSPGVKDLAAVESFTQNALRTFAELNS